eukprot:NODE_800_length_1443_cov_23.931133_g662_i0.p3 GENE.NODE_800_length_1443_cov_23.931133_g662_i0~~NODE_800_length_1443_cov_23.931133_g662_i0.p3  ORF type:complete len:132 (+),score=39.43 NODE_800_length_1443_cov_23.931133_g662_i0:973-1368(+)
MRKGTQVDIPLWLARALRPGGFVRLHPADHYQPSFRPKVKASVSRMSLQAYSPYYFHAGQALASMLGAPDKEDALRRMLFEVFLGRFVALMSMSERSSVEHGQLKEGLSVLEKSVFDVMHRTQSRKQAWAK